MDEEWTLELRKFFSAKRIWHERDKPAGPITLRGGDEWSGTQAEWFQLMYREPLEAYAERAKREGIRARVEEWKREKGIGQPVPPAGEQGS